MTTKRGAGPLDARPWVRSGLVGQRPGPGVPEEIKDKIFDPYFSTKKLGVGLGLSTAYSIIQKHDGYIGVESQVGVGTEFYLYLPASSQDPKSRENCEEMPVTDSAKILVMDEPTSALDEKDVATLYKVIRKLRDEGVAIIYISHRMEEVFQITERVIVLRDGKKVGDTQIGERGSPLKVPRTLEVSGALSGRRQASLRRFAS